MSRGDSSSGWLPGGVYDTIFEGGASGYEESYGQETGYTNLVGAQHFSGFDQQFSTSREAVSTLQPTLLPLENLSQHELENDSRSDHSTPYPPGPIASSSYRYPDL